MSMRVLHVAHSDGGGGAFRAAYRIHVALRDAGVDSEMLVRRKVTDDVSVRRIRQRNDLGGVVRPAVEAQLQRLQRTPNTALHSSNVLPTRVSRVIDRAGADVVNLHWIGHGLLSIEDVGRISTPVVMRLDDMWAFCGSEHVTDISSAARWRHGYPEWRRGARIDLDRSTWRRKRRAWPVTHCICPSRWLARLARESALMREWPIHVVPNTLDVDQFRPFARAAAREILGIPADVPTVLFGALPRDFTGNKGFDDVVAALELLRRDVPDVVAIVLGRSAAGGPLRLPTPTHFVGHLHDDVSIATAYNAADLVLVPSLQESFGQVASEAHACGVPVVAYGGSGLDDVVVDGETGYLVVERSSAALAAAARRALASPVSLAAMASKARLRAVDTWSYAVVARQLVSIYEEAREDARSRV